MNTTQLEKLNQWARKSTLEQIKNLSEDEILNMAIERPGHVGQFGFMLQLGYFKSQDHLAKITHALMIRLGQVENVKEKKQNMENTLGTSEISMEEFDKVGEVSKRFSENGVSENPPKFVIVVGGVGSGKTTMRRQTYSTGYVNFEFGEILTAIKKALGDDGSRSNRLVSLACDFILHESLDKKKNIVIEIIGDNKELIDPVLDGMKKLGYDVSVELILCDPVEAYKRHLKLVEEDKDYLSAFFTQEATLSFFYNRLDLGKMPEAIQGS